MLGVSDVHVGIAVSVMLFASLALFVVAAKLMERGIGIRELPRPGAGAQDARRA
jgi:hypothetical protein